MPYHKYPHLRVLIVENSQAHGYGLELTYRSWGWAVEWAFDGASGLAKAAVFAPDVVVLDYYLPDMTGLEFVEKLGAAGGGRPRPPVVAFTAAADSDVEKIEAAGLRVVRKPADPGELAAALEGAVARGADGGGPAGG